jgi:exopolysaccharide biosynthesis polyprenyl glycosylphosphotransferase
MAGTEEPALLSQPEFLKMLHVEQKRSERSGRPFVLMLLERAGGAENGRTRTEWPADLLKRIGGATRETDIKGWYRQDASLGVIFTEIPAEGARSIVGVLAGKIERVLREIGKSAQDYELVFFLYPQDWHEDSGGPRIEEDRIDLVRDVPRKRAAVIKRLIDIAGSASALVVLSPVFAAVAIAIKLTSPGPVIFRQERVGQWGRRFTFLKFRSMHVDNNPEIHRSYVSGLIRGRQDEGTPVYKLTNDPRVTRLGKLLRRSSLDELPQFWNVLMGDMSLVGPRPALDYEVQEYAAWQRHRLAVKPGITGLWQVDGRSRVAFADAVRLDLRYARQFSIWEDLRILLRTPRAVLTGRGAH